MQNLRRLENGLVITSDIEFYVYFKKLKVFCKENKLREFYFKFLHRIIVTRKEFNYSLGNYQINLTPVHPI